MNVFSKKFFGVMQSLKLGLFVILLGVSIAGNAQQVLGTSRTGTIQALEQDDGYLIISGVQYGYDREITEVTFEGEEFDDAEFEIGMVLRFTLRGSMITTIEVLGPYTVLEDRDTH